MVFYVKDLLKLDTMQRAKVIGGERWLDNEITGTTIIEAPDILQFVGGGELIFTSLYPFNTCSSEEYENHMSKLFERGIGALVLKRGRNITTEEKRVRFLVTLSDACRVPVIEIPLGLAYKDIMYPVMERLFNEEVTKLKYFKETHDRFISLSLSHAFSEKRYQSILESLSELIGSAAALFDANRSCIAATGQKLSMPDIGGGFSERKFTAYSRYTFLSSEIKPDGNGDSHSAHIIVPIDNPAFDISMYLAIAASKSPESPLDYIAIENACTALLLESAKQHALAAMEKKFRSDIFEQMLRGRIRGKERLHMASGVLGLDADASYRALVFDIYDLESRVVADYAEQLEQRKILYEAVAEHFPHGNVHSHMDNVVTLFRVKPKQKYENMAREIGDKAEAVRRVVQGRAASLSVRVGVGNEARGVSEIPRSFKEACEALFLIEATEEFGGGNSPAVFFSDLGILRIFSHFKNPAALGEFVPNSLKKLNDYNKPSKHDLLATLKSYLSNNRNITRTAQDMFVHYKTVVYRINKVVEITGIDFNNPDEVLSVQLGLIILRFIENNVKP